MYYLDANICIYFLKGKYQPLQDKFRAISPNKIKIPAIVRGEIMVSVEKGAKGITRELWNNFFDAFEIVAFDDVAAKQYSIIRADLEMNGKKIGPNDFIIAATVLVNNGILVTHNTNEFKRVPNLIIEDWTI
ncbi:MAG: type II toxin-antitoxin system VapC family toxin [Spirochaetia bacterium]|jgi:tRNA(fMet)-specific endonuclease VapC|nr:type II toxin-antitoxin system VapC family toxin [Spirochaetia bacterium]